MRYFLWVAYNGCGYAGWQIQTKQSVRTIQGVMQTTLTDLLQQPIALVGSGRTDTGVHARGQVAHFDSDRLLPMAHYLPRINACLPQGIALRNLCLVNPQAHARYHAYSRTYVYRVHTYKDAFLSANSYYYSRSLNVQRMNQAAQALVGVRSYEVLRRRRRTIPVGASTVCSVQRAYWKDLGRGQYAFVIRANRFLRGMVRSAVGLLLQVGTGRILPTEMMQILTHSNRLPCIITAPAHGLYLAVVRYPITVYDTTLVDFSFAQAKTV